MHASLKALEKILPDTFSLLDRPVAYPTLGMKADWKEGTCCTLATATRAASKRKGAKFKVFFWNASLGNLAGQEFHTRTPSSKFSFSDYANHATWCFFCRWHSVVVVYQPGSGARNSKTRVPPKALVFNPDRNGNPHLVQRLLGRDHLRVPDPTLVYGDQTPDETDCRRRCLTYIANLNQDFSIE